MICFRTSRSHLQDGEIKFIRSFRRSLSARAQPKVKPRIPDWKVSSTLRGHRFRVPRCPTFPPPNLSRALKTGKKIEKGVSLSVFTRTAAHRLTTFSRQVKRAKKSNNNNNINYSALIDEIYSRRIDQLHGWGADVSTRRYRLRNGKQRNQFTEFGLPHLRGERMTQLWNDLCAIDWDRQRLGQDSDTRLTTAALLDGHSTVSLRLTRSENNGLGFERTRQPLETKTTIENRLLEREGLEILRQRKTLMHWRLQRSDPFYNI